MWLEHDFRGTQMGIRGTLLIFMVNDLAAESEKKAEGWTDESRARFFLFSTYRKLR